MKLGMHLAQVIFTDCLYLQTLRAMPASIVYTGVKSYEFNMLELYGLRRVHSPLDEQWRGSGAGNNPLKSPEEADKIRLICRISPVGRIGLKHPSTRYLTP